MKQILFSVFIGLAFSAWAQAPKEPAAKEPAKPMAQEPVKAAPAKQAAAKKPRRWNEDARHCLERGSTTEIIKCAEEYL